LNQKTEPTYRSGTAARLAGIPVDTLRMWERRYQVVGPQLSARGHRRYAAMKKEIDGPLAQLIRDLDERKLLSRTLVVVVVNGLVGADAG